MVSPQELNRYCGFSVLVHSAGEFCSTQVTERGLKRL